MENLLLLQEKLNLAKNNSTELLSKLHHVEGRLIRIETKMKPIQITTDKYSTAQENIGRTLVEVEKTYEYFRIASEAKDVINNGISSSKSKAHNKDDIDSSNNHKIFFDALKKLTNAKKFFEEHTEIKSAASVLRTIESLLKSGLSSCAEEFERLINLIAGGVDIIDTNTYKIMGDIDPDICSDIKSICNILDENNQVDHFESYSKLRSRRVIFDINKFILDNNADWMALRNEVPYQKGSHPFINLYDYVLEVIRGEFHLWSQLMPSSETSIKVFSVVSNTIILTLKKFLLTHLEGDAKDNESENFILKLTNRFLVSLDVFEIFQQKFEEYRDVLRIDQKTESSASMTMITLRNAIVTRSMSTVSELLKLTFDSGSNLGKADNAFNCDLHPMTGSILHCCKEMMEFSSTYRYLIDLAKEISVGVPTKALSLQELNIVLINKLLDSLESKSKEFDIALPKVHDLKLRHLDITKSSAYDLGEKEASTALKYSFKYLFLANNYFSIVIYLHEKQNGFQSSESTYIQQQRRQGITNTPVITDSYSKSLQTILSTCESKLSKAQVDFCEYVASALGLGSIDMIDFKTANDSDKSGKHRAVKAKFMIFNSGLDALLNLQGELRVSASALREFITKQLISKILPVYSQFFNTFASTKFSKKHINLYLKYPPQDVDAMLKTYFG